jgi:predicted amidohydrolase
MARFVRVSTISFRGVADGPDYQKRMLDEGRAALKEAARAKPDLVALPEVWNVLGTGERWYDLAEPVPGPTVDMCADMAKKHKMNVVCPIPTLHGKKKYNAAVFINRHGEVVGEYHKYQPTIGEIEHGIIPGEDAEVFQLDIGPVGAAICFDLKFVEVGQRLAANGARLVVFASMFIGGVRINHWARDLGAYMLSSCPARSYIVDMGGERVLAQTGWELNQVAAGLLPPIASAVINMDRCFLHLDTNQNKFPEILKKYGGKVEIEDYYPEAHFTLASLMKDKTVEDLIEEFELEPWTQYLNRARGVREKALKDLRRK